MRSRIIARIGFVCALVALGATQAVAQGIYPYQLEATDTPSDNELPTYDNATGKFTWEADGGGDVTDVFDCASGNCADVVVGATDSLDFSAIDANAAGEGLVLPQTTACGGSGIATGAICYGTTGDDLCVWDGAAWDCQTLGVAGDVTDVYGCSSGDCADISAGATDSLDFSAADANAAGEGIILPQTTSCGGSGQATGSICYGTTSDELCVWDGAAWDCQVLGAAASGDITDVFGCASGDCADVAVGATDSLDFSAIDGDAAGEGLILPQTTACGGSGQATGAICYGTTSDELCVWDGAAWDCQTLGVTDTGDITDVFNCASGDCADIAAGATDSMSFAAIDASATGEGLILPQTATCGGTGYDAGAVCYDTGTDSICVGDGAAWDCQVLGVTDTNTNASTICAGTTTYLDGEGNCDDISSVYAAASHSHTGADLSGIDISDDTNLAAGAGLSLTGDTLATASTEQSFLLDVTELACGASTKGQMAVLDGGTTLQYCDDAGTPAQHYVALGSSTGVATSATALAADPADCATATHFAVGVTAGGVATCEAIGTADLPTITTALGGMGADISGYTAGLLGLSGGAAVDVDTVAEVNTALGSTLIREHYTHATDCPGTYATSCNAAGEEGNTCYDYDDERYFACDGSGWTAISAAATIADGSVTEPKMATADFGDWSCGAGAGDCTLDNDVVAAAEMADADHGDVNWSAGVASVEDDSHAHGSSTLSGVDISADTNLAAGAGLAITDDTLSTASSEADFLASGALVCGAATQGKAQVHTTPLQYCDNAATPTLQYAAYGSSTGVATSASALAANGANCAAGNYPLGVDTAGAVEDCTADDDIPDNATDLAAIDSETELVAVADGDDANFDNIFADNEAAGAFDLDNTQTECLTLLASGIVCLGTAGCTDAADTDGTNFSYRTAAFATDADDVGSFVFKTPLNMAGTTAAVRFAWVSNNAACDNGADDDVCWTVDGDSYAHDAAFNSGALGGTEVGTSSRCTANGDIVVSSAVTFTHSMSPDETAVVSIRRDADETIGSCSDDYGQSAGLVWVEFCYEVDNLNSGEN